jgi:hypothetical protein
MAQHVRVNAELEPGLMARPRDHLGEARALSFAPRSYSLAWLPNQSPAAGYRIAP